MPGDNPRDAVVAFVTPLQQVVHCVANAIVNPGGGYYPREEPHSVVLNDGQPVPLRGGRKSLSLSVVHSYRIVDVKAPEGRWKVSSAGYIYTLKELDQALIAWHWHPWNVAFPHLHLYEAEQLGRPDLARIHYPTGRISLESIARFLIREYDVQPRQENYDEILNQTEKAFRRARTWS